MRKLTAVARNLVPLTDPVAEELRRLLAIPSAETLVCLSRRFQTRGGHRIETRYYRVNPDDGTFWKIRVYRHESAQEARCHAMFDSWAAGQRHQSGPLTAWARSVWPQ